MESKIWTPFKIWNETQWFTDMDKFIKEFQKHKKRILSNDFWKNSRNKDKNLIK